MQKYNKDSKCPKCGFLPTFQTKWKLEFKDSCSQYGYNKCDWQDETNNEHLHQECPDCGYTFPVACLDNEAVTANTWSTTAPVAVKPLTGGTMGQLNQETQVMIAQNKVTPIAGTRYVNGQPVTTVTPIHQSSTPVKCRTCPVE